MAPRSSSAFVLNYWLLALGIAYVALVLVHGFWQWWAIRAHRHRPITRPLGELPSIDVLVPCYNEDPRLLAACCESLQAAGRNYRGKVRFWLIDDGSANREALQPIYSRYGSMPGWTVHLLAGNQGKRCAQAVAFGEGQADLVLTIDSDTVVDPKSLWRLAERFNDKRVGAATGNVRVANVKINLLTQLIFRRYRMLFEQERAAQGNYGAVTCSSGPFSMYRRSVLSSVWPQYLEQRYHRRRCISGDDIHLTNLVMAARHLAVYEPLAVANTYAPTTLRGYVRQQLRWNRSLYRELHWIGPALRGVAAHRRSPAAYLCLDIAARVLLPLAIPAAMILTGIDGLRGGHERLVTGMVMVIAILGIHAVSLVLRGNAPEFVVLYGLLYLAVLVPMRLWALVTLAESQWVTRKAPPTASPQARRSRSSNTPLPSASSGT